MKTYAALISTFMSTVAVIYTMVIHVYVIEPYHVQRWTVDWVWLSIPAFMLVIYSIGLVLYAVMPVIGQPIQPDGTKQGFHQSHQ